MSADAGERTLPDLQELLLEALLDGRLEEFRRLLAHPAVNPTHKYGKPHFGTALEIACRHRDRHQFVKELLVKVKPNVNHVVPEPIHYAAGRGNAEALELLLKDKRTKINAQDSAGRTALHYAAKNFPEGEDSRHFERCLELLLAHPELDADRPSFKGFIAAHEAVSSPAGKAAVEAVLRAARGAGRSLDLDSWRGHGRSARDAILARFPEMKETLERMRGRHDGGDDDPQRGTIET